MTGTLYPFTSKANGVPLEVQTLEERHQEWDVRPHAHAFFELIIATSSTVENAIFIIPPGAIHDCTEFGIFDALIIRFLADAVDGTESGLAAVERIPDGMAFDIFRRPLLELLEPLVIDRAFHAELLAAAQRIREEVLNKRPGYEQVARSILLTELIELARRSPQPVAKHEDPQARSLLLQVFADIDAHYAEDAALSAAAQRLGLSAAYLTTQLRKLTGKTYGDWVIERRMIEARRLLIATDLSVAAIAEQLGYTEPASFTRRFRSRHAITPAGWRAKSRTTNQKTPTS